ncbi:MAG: hypothetical protein EAZ95_01605 [Bacteroidetes bacterium]|nr:MAG: hypothetical protein EAZ95_01605 [Bacteroidota bacterium]
MGLSAIVRFGRQGFQRIQAPKQARLPPCLLFRILQLAYVFFSACRIDNWKETNRSYTKIILNLRTTLYHKDTRTQGKKVKVSFVTLCPCGQYAF